MTGTGTLRFAHNVQAILPNNRPANAVLAFSQNRAYEDIIGNTGDRNASVGLLHKMNSGSHKQTKHFGTRGSRGDQAQSRLTSLISAAALYDSHNRHNAAETGNAETWKETGVLCWMV